MNGNDSLLFYPDILFWDIVFTTGCIRQFLSYVPFFYSIPLFLHCDVHIKTVNNQSWRQNIDFN